LKPNEAAYTTATPLLSGDSADDDRDTHDDAAAGLSDPSVEVNRHNEDEFPGEPETIPLQLQQSMHASESDITGQSEISTPLISSIDGDGDRAGSSDVEKGIGQSGSSYSLDLQLPLTAGGESLEHRSVYISSEPFTPLNPDHNSVNQLCEFHPGQEPEPSANKKREEAEEGVFNAPKTTDEALAENQGEHLVALIHHLPSVLWTNPVSHLQRIKQFEVLVARIHQSSVLSLQRKQQMEGVMQKIADLNQNLGVITDVNANLQSESSAWIPHLLEGRDAPGEESWTVTDLIDCIQKQLRMQDEWEQMFQSQISLVRLLQDALRNHHYSLLQTPPPPASESVQDSSTRTTSKNSYSSNLTRSVPHFRDLVSSPEHPVNQVSASDAHSSERPVGSASRSLASDQRANFLSSSFPPREAEGQLSSNSKSMANATTQWSSVSRSSASAREENLARDAATNTSKGASRESSTSLSALPNTPPTPSMVSVSERDADYESSSSVTSDFSLGGQFRPAYASPYLISAEEFTSFRKQLYKDPLFTEELNKILELDLKAFAPPSSKLPLTFETRVYTPTTDSLSRQVSLRSLPSAMHNFSTSLIRSTEQFRPPRHNSQVMRKSIPGAVKPSHRPASRTPSLQAFKNLPARVVNNTSIGSSSSSDSHSVSVDSPFEPDLNTSAQSTAPQNLQVLGNDLTANEVNFSDTYPALEEDDGAKIWLHSRGSSPVKKAAQREPKPRLLEGSNVYIHKSSSSSPLTSDHNQSPSIHSVTPGSNNDLQEALGLSENSQDSLPAVDDEIRRDRSRNFNSPEKASKKFPAMLKGGGSEVVVGSDGQVYSLSPQKTGFLRSGTANLPSLRGSAYSTSPSGTSKPLSGSSPSDSSNLSDCAEASLSEASETSLISGLNRSANSVKSQSSVDPAAKGISLAPSNSSSVHSSASAFSSLVQSPEKLRPTQVGSTANHTIALEQRRDNLRLRIGNLLAVDSREARANLGNLMNELDSVQRKLEQI